jgi:hypothetical protein
MESLRRTSPLSRETLLRSALVGWMCQCKKNRGIALDKRVRFQPKLRGAGGDVINYALVVALSALAGAGIDRLLVVQALRSRGFRWSTLKDRPTLKERLAGLTAKPIWLCPMCGSANVVTIGLSGERRLYCRNCWQKSNFPT